MTSPCFPGRPGRFRVVALAVVLGVASLVATTGARADDIEDFEDARSAYETGNYPVSVERFEALVGGEVPRLTNPALVLESRKYLAASLLFVSREPDAERQFELLLRQDPDYQIDPVQFPTAVVDVFNRVRRRLERDLRAVREQRDREQRLARDRERQRQQRDRRRLAALRRLATTETVVERRSRMIAWIPIAGQIQNGHGGLAAALAILDGVLLATNVVSFIIHDSLPTPGTADDQPAPSEQDAATAAATASRLTNQISLGALGLSLVIGVIDAQIRFVPSRRIERQRALPPELRARFGPTSFSLTF
ncbi:MAG: hypothetical protein IT379_29440 [Deltaproteobacteria bacterium]|nr:hypothetical protein [Deltaproteobacteria bacterium]